MYVAFWCCSIDFHYLQYIGCTNLVAGKPFKITYDLILYAFYQSVPVVIIFIPLILLIYKIRHINSPIWSIIIFSVLCILSFIVIYPLFEKSKNIAYREFNISYNSNVKTRLSGGYFRKDSSKVYYFLNENEEDFSNVILLNDSNDINFFGDKQKLDVSENSNFYKNAVPFRDPCIKETLNNMPYEVMNAISVIRDKASLEWNKGWIAWFCFCSLGFAMASAYSYIKISSWRMVNYLFIVFSNIFIFVFNYIYYTPFFSNIRIHLNEFIYGKEAVRFSFFLDRNIDLAICIINLSFAILTILFGCLFTSFRNNRR